MQKQKVPGTSGLFSLPKSRCVHQPATIIDLSTGMH